MPTILATAQIIGGALGPHSRNVQWKNDILSFEIEERYKGNFVPIISHCVNRPYVTSTTGSSKSVPNTSSSCSARKTPAAEFILPPILQP